MVILASLQRGHTRHAAECFAKCSRVYLQFLGRNCYGVDIVKIPWPLLCDGWRKLRCRRQVWFQKMLSQASDWRLGGVQPSAATGPRTDPSCGEISSTILTLSRFHCWSVQDPTLRSRIVRCALYLTCCEKGKTRLSTPKAVRGDLDRRDVCSHHRQRFDTWSKRG